MCFLCVYCFCCPLRYGAIGTAVYCILANLAGIIICALILTTCSEKLKAEFHDVSNAEELRRAVVTTAIIFLAVFGVYLVVNVALLVGICLDVQELVLQWLILTGIYMIFVIVAFILREVYYSAVYTTFDLYFILNTVIHIYLYWIVFSYYDDLREVSDSDSSDD